MFRFICKSKRSLHRGNFLNGDSSKTLLSRFLEFPYFVKSMSNVSDYDNSFTVSYLINSCGLSVDKATSISKKLHLKNSNQPDSVLAFLRSYGLTTTQISRSVSLFPGLLSANPIKTLKPKFEFFRSLGLSEYDLSAVFSDNPFILKVSLTKRIIPNIDILKKVVHTDDNIISIIKRNSRYALTHDIKETVEHNISLLRIHGVPESYISKIVAAQPTTILVKGDRFKNIVEEVRKMGFVASTYAFCTLVQILSSMSESTKEEKINTFKKWGWSDEMIDAAIRREPTILSLSEKTIMLKMDYLVNKMGYAPSLIAKYAALLKYSMEKRIIPRYSIIQVLISNDLVKQKLKPYPVFRVSNKEFLETFVTKYKNEVPGLVDLYQGKLAGSK
ncbi:hypothetical protein ACHQM5_000355 [Ranunculus cassubicifolius]